MSNVNSSLTIRVATAGVSQSAASFANLSVAIKAIDSSLLALRNAAEILTNTLAPGFAATGLAAGQTAASAGVLSKQWLQTGAAAGVMDAATRTATSGLNAHTAGLIRAAFSTNNLFIQGQQATASANNLRAGLSAIRPVVSLLGFQMFPQLTGAISVSREAMRYLEQQSSLTSAQLTRLGVLGAVAAASAYGVQKSFEVLWEAENQLAQTQGAEHQQRQLLDFVVKLGKAGEITGRQMLDLTRQLQGAPDTTKINAIRKGLRTILADRPSAVDLLRFQLKNAASSGATLQASSDTFAPRGLANEGERAINDNLIQQAELWRDINAALGERQDKLRASLELTDAEIAKNKEWQSLENERADALAQEMALRRNVRDREKAINTQRLDGTRDMFGNMAAAAKAFGRDGFAAYKAFATAAALVDTYKSAVAAYSSMVSIPYVGPALGVAAAAAAVAAGLANVAQINSQSYAEGGFTGAGGKYDVAGVVHRGEWVMPASSVDAWGHGALSAFQSGPQAFSRSPNVNVASPEVHIAVITDMDKQAKRFLESNLAKQIIFHHVNSGRGELGFQT